MASLRLLFASTAEVQIPLEVFVALMVVFVTAFIGFLGWLTKQVIELAKAISAVQSQLQEIQKEIEGH